MIVIGVLGANEDRFVGQVADEDVAVVAAGQFDALADVSPRVVDLRRSVDVGEAAEDEAVRAVSRIGEAVDDYFWAGSFCFEHRSDSGVELEVVDPAPGLVGQRTLRSGLLSDIDIGGCKFRFDFDFSGSKFRSDLTSIALNSGFILTSVVPSIGSNFISVVPNSGLNLTSVVPSIGSNLLLKSSPM